MFEHIVVALNGSNCAMQALNVALDLAKVKGAKVEICTVVDPMAAMWRISSGSGEHEIGEAQREADILVNQAVARARQAGVIAAGHVRAGDPADEITACAVTTGADAIVMGTHGWTGIKHFVMGSVAESVLHSAPCPVLVIRDGAALPHAGAAVQKAPV